QTPAQSRHRLLDLFSRTFLHHAPSLAGNDGHESARRFANSNRRVSVSNNEKEQNAAHHSNSATFS
ncbi:MAG TPA: hypothetical protein VIG90_10085, partial [Pedomonas sp.]|uniref:hypothetical protein n=1 Tax=Pedomonas sp. TaxID=2976421 RepID=UPI002F403AEF